MAKIKIGIIGLGMAWERLHSPAFARLSDKFEITAVCDTDMNKAKEVAQFLGLPSDAAYDDYNVMLKKADIKTVDTMVPISGNYECAKAVIKSGKHLIAEKPFCAEPEKVKELIKLRDKHGVYVLVAENFRYDEENVLIKNLISEHRIGNVIYFIDNNVTEFQKDMLGDSFAGKEWRQHPDFKGGIFLDSGIHHIARHRFLFGRVNNIFASGRETTVDFAPYSCINALLTFDCDIAGHYSFYAIGKETQAPLVGLRIFGTGGEIYLEDKCCGFVNVSYKDGYHEAIPYKPGEGYYHELDNFYRAINDNAEIVSTPEKELGDIEVVYAILESAEQESSIRPDDNYRPKTKNMRSSNPIAS